MADLSSLTAAGNRTGDELVPGSQGGLARKFTSRQLGRPARVKAGLTADLAAADYHAGGAGAVVSWTSEIRDELNAFSTGTNPSRITPGYVGWGNLNASVGINSTIDDVQAHIALMKNGVIFSWASMGTKNVVRGLNITANDVDFTATDYFEVYVLMVADASVGVVAARSYFSLLGFAN